MLTDKNPPPANIMVISDPRTFPCFYGLLEAQGYNILQPFPYDSLHSFFHPDSCALEAVESAWWKCFICPHDPPAQGSDNFTTHLAREEHHQMQFPEVLRTNVVGLPMAPLVSHPPIATTLVSDHPPMNIRLQYIFGPLRDSHDLKAVTVVFWDINMCPIPSGVDARWVGPRIKQFLEKSGYSGPLTITAVGALKDVPNGILGELFSSRISLDNVAYGSSSIEDLIFQFQDMNPPPANIMVISDPTIFPSEDSGWLQSSGYNLIQPYPYDSLQSFLPTDSGELDCMEVGESASWVCSVCRSPPGQVFENFTTHLSSQVHERKTLGCRPRN
ncbi:PREDICTED: uncharacterized protein LOC104768667 [Camelina sativa]|uniref:Uncharacterized protein LOC104768667 n=1 Tax=Camelina sativa TaxID=90675 RepID=A0ABM0XTY4_CAMSA|nr:PREDICTED: uncharacterized protein LOC104768667 [Camelina sativa]XP_010491006.1 PREDICTED: uncharacterized protein LOC104768667 [Camelina sativa]XP_010491012.1 PREDICTED: uncharacterized protein LOC104768667 [Camelina sativa]